jgi:hypothetical protein
MFLVVIAKAESERARRALPPARGRRCRARVRRMPRADRACERRPLGFVRGERRRRSDRCRSPSSAMGGAVRVFAILARAAVMARRRRGL